MAMNKGKMLKIINPLLSIVFFCLAGTGLFQSIIPYEVFHTVHGKLGYAFVILAIIHIYLNWNWIKNLMKKK